MCSGVIYGQTWAIIPRLPPVCVQNPRKQSFIMFYVAAKQKNQKWTKNRQFPTPCHLSKSEKSEGSQGNEGATRSCHQH